ncbi:MAG: hypothetical protein GXP14_09495 [Gammaproteobacteria bacterium]|nr:hypothetical protein [Gammaproteobacteria bacterium]
MRRLKMIVLMTLLVISRGVLAFPLTGSIVFSEGNTIVSGTDYSNATELWFGPEPTSHFDIQDPNMPRNSASSATGYFRGYENERAGFRGNLLIDPLAPETSWGWDAFDIGFTISTLNILDRDTHTLSLAGTGIMSTFDGEVAGVWDLTNNVLTFSTDISAPENTFVLPPGHDFSLATGPHLEHLPDPDAIPYPEDSFILVPDHGYVPVADEETVVVGHGYIPGRDHGYVPVSVPTPNVLILLGLGLVGMGVSRRFKKEQ